MILKISKLLTTVVLFIASTNVLYCMEDENPINNINSRVSNMSLSFSNTLHDITTNQTELALCEDIKKTYKTKLDSITKDIRKTIEIYEKSLLEMKNSNNNELDRLNEATNYHLDNLITFNKRKSAIVKSIKSCEEKIDKAISIIKEQCKTFYDQLFENDGINNFKYILPKMTNDTLKIIQKMLEMRYVKNLITLPGRVPEQGFLHYEELKNDKYNLNNIVKFKQNKIRYANEYKQKINNMVKIEYDEIEEFISEINNIPYNNRNTEMNNIINITTEYLNSKKQSILTWEQRVVESHLRDIEKEANK